MSEKLLLEHTQGKVITDKDRPLVEHHSPEANRSLPFVCAHVLQMLICCLALCDRDTCADSCVAVPRSCFCFSHGSPARKQSPFTTVWWWGRTLHTFMQFIATHTLTHTHTTHNCWVTRHESLFACVNSTWETDENSLYRVSDCDTREQHRGASVVCVCVCVNGQFAHARMYCHRSQWAWRYTTISHWWRLHARERSLAPSAVLILTVVTCRCRVFTINCSAWSPSIPNCVTLSQGITSNCEP